MPESSTVTATELITELGALHRRIDDGFTYLLTHANEHANYAAACRRWNALAIEYIERIEQAKKTMPTSEANQLVTTYAARLERGWQMDVSERVNEAFAVILNQYMALCDIQGEINITWYLTSPEGTRQKLLDRIANYARGHVA